MKPHCLLSATVGEKRIHAGLLLILPLIRSVHDVANVKKNYKDSIRYNDETQLINRLPLFVVGYSNFFDRKKERR